MPFDKTVQVETYHLCQAVDDGSALRVFRIAHQEKQLIHQRSIDLILQRKLTRKQAAQRLQRHRTQLGIRQQGRNGGHNVGQMPFDAFLQFNATRVGQRNVATTTGRARRQLLQRSDEHAHTKRSQRGVGTQLQHLLKKIRVVRGPIQFRAVDDDFSRLVEQKTIEGVGSFPGHSKFQHKRS